MWSDADFTSVGGGFDNLDSQTQNAASAVDNKKRNSSSIPVSIKQILDSNEDQLQVGGLPVTMIEIVGVIRSKNISSTKVIFKIADWSGVDIDALLWLESDDDLKKLSVDENMYAKLTGTLRRNENSKYIFLYNIEAIDNLQQLTHHYLKIVHIPFKAEEQRQVKIPENDITMSMNNQNSMNLTPQQNRVYQTIQNAQSDAGIERNEILQTVKISTDELNKIIQFLIDEGHIYATIDDFHFRATDS